MLNHDHSHDRGERDDRKHDTHEPGRSLAARFRSPAEARGAVAALHKAHFTHTWFGTTSAATADGGQTTLTVESSGFFSQTQSLVDALVAQGVLGDVARQIEAELEPGDALVTVDPRDRDALEAVSLLEQYGGRIAGSESDRDDDEWLTPAQARVAMPHHADSLTSVTEGDVFYQQGTPRHQ